MRLTTMKSSTPKISFVIPTQNRAKELPKTLQSLISQTEPDWEAVVVDDHSSDNTYEAVSNLKDSRIRYYRLPAGRGTGIATARNYGNMLAKADLIAVLDSHDFALPDRAERAIKSHKQHGWDMYSARRRLIGDISSHALTKPQPLPDKWDPELIKTFNYVVHISMVYTKRAAMEIPYNPAFVALEDYDLITRFIALGKKIYYDPQVVVVHNAEPGVSALLDKNLRNNTLQAIRALRGYPSEGYDLEELAK